MKILKRSRASCPFVSTFAGKFIDHNKEDVVAQLLPTPCRLLVLLVLLLLERRVDRD